MQLPCKLLLPLEIRTIHVQVQLMTLTLTGTKHPAALQPVRLTCLTSAVITATAIKALS